MEQRRRQWRRWPLDTTVRVFYRGVPVLATRTRNISRTGLALDRVAVELFPNRSVVEVEMAIAGDGDAEPFRIPAAVIHNDGACGLAFRAPSGAVRRLVDRLEADWPAAGDRGTG